jgi:MFS family permease
MSAVATQAGAPAAASGPGTNPWLIAVLVALATFMEVLDTTIANVALRYIAGGLGVSEDEASWVVTTYLVANAIIVTASAFLAKVLGRKIFFLICMALFTASSVLCGLAWSLQSLLFFRLLQGFAGGGMVPVAQSILADSLPPENSGQAFAVFGVAVVVAPVVGPTLGGWLSDNWSWHWCFLIKGPVGVIAIALIALIVRESAAAAEEQRKWREQGGAFDLYGDIGFWFMAHSRMLFGVGFPLIFVSITTASYDGIPPEKTGQAAALINAARNTGGSIGVSLTSNVLWDRQQFHQTRLVEHAIPSSIQYQETLHQITNYFLGRGSLLPQARQQAINWIGQQVCRPKRRFWPTSTLFGC